MGIINKAPLMAMWWKQPSILSARIAHAGKEGKIRKRLKRRMQGDKMCDRRHLQEDRWRETKLLKTFGSVRNKEKRGIIKREREQEVDRACINARKWIKHSCNQYHDFDTSSTKRKRSSFPSNCSPSA